MTSPIIDERMLLQVLDCTAAYENVEQLQQGALMAMIDAYDRKVTRDEFIPIVQAFANLVDSVGRLALLHSVVTFAKAHDDKVGTVDLERANQGVHEMVAHNAKIVTSIVERLRECPLDEDRVH